MLHSLTSKNLHVYHIQRLRTVTTTKNNVQGTNHQRNNLQRQKLTLYWIFLIIKSPKTNQNIISNKSKTNQNIILIVNSGVLSNY